MQHTDIVVIGGGHNGLVASAYLAKAGHRTLVVERRGGLGGAAATEEAFPGFQIDTGAGDAGLFLPEVSRELGLEKRGLEFIEGPICALSLLPEGGALRLWGDLDATRREIEPRSLADAAHYAGFAALIKQQASVLKSFLRLAPPKFPFSGYLEAVPEILPWMRLAIRVRRSGRRATGELLRNLPLAADALLDDWFEDPALKGALAAAAIPGTMQGPKASGTAFMMLYHSIAGFPRGLRTVRGGLGRLATAIADAAMEAGAEVRLGVAVEKILVNDYRVAGVRLSTGEEIRCKAVASAADPRHTLLDLVRAPELELRVVRRVTNIRFRGCTAKVNLALERLPTFEGVRDPSHLSGRILVSPKMEYLERAYDDAKYGRWSTDPFLDMTIPSIRDSSLAPEGKHVMSVTMQYAPYELRDDNWDDQRESLGDHIINTAAQFAPDLPDLIMHRQVLTPLDYERDYGLPEGSIYHGQMALDQLFVMRPISGYGRYRSPVDGLYFCGAGAHPGGGVTGAPGRNAAQIIAKDLKNRRIRAAA